MGVALIAGWFCVVIDNLGRPCGGDGGSPYAAAGSAADRFCSSGGQLALWLLPVAGFVLGAVLASRRATTLSLWGWPFGAVALDLGLAVSVRRLALQ
jgi:hypothetical protein